MARRLANFRHDCRMYAYNLRLQLRAAAALRAAFLIQVVGMIINNSILVFAWLLFFMHFGTVHGWTTADYVGFQGVSMLVYGVISFTCVGLIDLGRHVDSGALDAFLTKPMSVLGNVASSSIDATTLGDIVIGGGFLTWYMLHLQVAPSRAALLGVALVTAAIIFWCFAALLPSLLAFYVFESEALSRYIGQFFIDTTVYPTGVLGGGLRTFFLFAFPGLLVGAVPVDILRGLRLEWAGLGLLVAAFWLILSLWLFRRALRKYESANLIGAR